jgi:methionyl-tRNA formyltransferase
MDFVFIGGTYRGYCLLKELTDQGYVPSLAFILKEDDHEKLKYSNQLSELAERLRIPYQIKKKLNRADEELIASRKRDFIIVCGWRTLINPNLNDSLLLGMVAAHDSLLPKYRGFAPINWAMINGDKETGVTLFLIGEDDVDSGDIIDQAIVKIEETEYAFDVYQKITMATVNLYLQFIQDYQKDSVRVRKQDDEEASYTCKRIPEDGKIDWSCDSTEILNLVRALAPPYPGAFCLFNEIPYIIHSAKLGSSNSRNFVRNIPGRIIHISDEGVEVMCGRGTMFLTKWENNNDHTTTIPSQIVRSITATLK